MINEYEDQAIPLCASNRTETGSPYCVSAYCPRCARQREIDDVPAVVPNGWMFFNDNPTGETNA